MLVLFLEQLVIIMHTRSSQPDNRDLFQESKVDFYLLLA